MRPRAEQMTLSVLAARRIYRWIRVRRLEKHFRCGMFYAPAGSFCTGLHEHPILSDPLAA